MGGLLDPRPGVVTKGFCTLAHEQEQEDSWQLDQPEEDEVTDSFIGLSGESTALFDQPCSTSSPSVCHNQNGDSDDRSQSETLHGEICGFRGAPRGKEGYVANSALPSVIPSPSLTLLSSSEMNGQVNLKEFQALQPSTVDSMPGEGAS